MVQDAYPHADTIFKIFARNRNKAERSIKFLQVALSAKFQGRARKPGLSKSDGFRHKPLAKLVATIGGGDHDPPDFYGFLSFRRQHTQCRGKRVAVQNAQVKGAYILAVDFGIGACLLDHEDVHAQFQHRIKCARGQIVDFSPMGGEQACVHQ